MRRSKKGKVVTTCAVLLVALCLHLLFASGKTIQDCSAGDIDLSNCYSSDNSKIEVLPDNLGSFYIVSAGTANTILSYFDGNTVISSPTLDFKYISAASDGNYIYIFYSLGTEKKVKKYKYENGNFTGPEIELTAKDWINFSVANNFVFSFVSAKDQKKDLVVYDPEGGVEVTENCNQFAVNSSKSKLYVQENDNNYLLAYNIDETGVSSEGKKIDPKNGNKDDLPDNLMHFLSDDILVTNTGKYFKLDSENSTIEHILSVDGSDLSVDFCSAVYKADSKNYIAALTSNNIVTFYDIDDSLTAKYKVELDVQDKIVSICTSGTKTILVWKNDTDTKVKLKAKILDKKDLTEIKNDTDPEPENPSDFEPVVKALNDTYTLSESERVYIPLSETISKVKDKLNLSGYNIEFKNYAGKAITSGKLGTGSVAIFSKDGKTAEFTFIVKGDVTGEGNANSRDVDCMYNHILGKSSLSEINAKAADINNDGVVDTLDLLLLSKMVSSSS